MICFSKLGHGNFQDHHKLAQASEEVMRGQEKFPELLTPTDFPFIKASFLESRSTETSLVYS